MGGFSLSLSVWIGLMNLRGIYFGGAISSGYTCAMYNYEITKMSNHQCNAWHNRMHIIHIEYVPVGTNYTPCSN